MERAFLAIVSAIAVMAVAGWLVAGASHGPGRHQFAVTVLNDRDARVSIQPCGRYFCNRYRAVNLAARGAHTWHTNDGDDGVRSFVVETASGGRILGCLAYHHATRANAPIAVRVSVLQKCIS
jgi:hypothetical protein